MKRILTFDFTRGLVIMVMVVTHRITWDYIYQLGRAYYAKGEYDKAIPYLRDAIERNNEVGYPRLFLAASYVRLGQAEDAEWEITQVQMLRPEYTLTHLHKTMPIGDENLRNRLFDDLRSAGLPE